MLTLILDNPLSVSHIISNDTRTCLCTFNGIDGSVTTTFGDEEVDVGPPQTQASGNCGAVFPNRKPRQVASFVAVATFIGAGPNPPTYNETFPTNGIAQPIGKLSLVPQASPQRLRSYDGFFAPRRHPLFIIPSRKWYLDTNRAHSQSVECLSHQPLRSCRVHFLWRRWQRD